MSAETPAFLYVEDDEASREVVGMIFRKVLAFSCYIFPDSHDFLDRIAALPVVPKVALLDIQIGPYDGFQLQTMLRDNDLYKDMIIIAMTASVTLDEIAKLKERGFDGLIGKPIKRESFVDAIKRIALGESVWVVTG